MKPLLFLFVLILVTHDLHSQTWVHQLDSLFRNYYKPEDPGAAIAIERAGKIILKKGYGLADLTTHESISASTNFNIGSLTKQFTAYSILQLEAKKRLSLDDKLIDFFPDFNKKTGQSIRIRQLLTHSSGMMDHYAYVDTSRVKHATDKDVLEAVKGIDSTYFVPGSRFRYSNTAYCLLGMIIEKLSGQSYREYIQKNIFLPLQMKQSAVLSMDVPIQKRATGYDRQINQPSFSRLDADESIFFSTEGDGGIYTSLDDYLKWYHALQKGNPVNPDLVAKARSAQFPVEPDNQLSYGYGWFISGSGEARSVYHTGSNGGFRAIVFTIPSLQYAVIIFSNRTDINLENMVIQINHILQLKNKTFTKIESLVSFRDCWPNFAP